MAKNTAQTKIARTARNYVAKHMRTFNKASVQEDKTKYNRKSKHKKYNLDLRLSITV